MNLLKRALSYYKDFFFQSLVFYLLFLSPLGSIGWKIGVFETSNIENLFSNFAKEPMELMIRLLLGFPVSMLYSFPFIICNIYLWQFNKFLEGWEEYLPLKIIVMIAISGFYILLCAHWYGYFQMLT